MRILLTAFEPFGGDPVNASHEVLQAVRARWHGPSTLATVVLPVTFRGAPLALADAVAAFGPDAVVCLGEVGGRDALTPERWAHHLADARIPDNSGEQPAATVLDDGPERLGSRIDVDALAAAISAAGVPAETSDDAGRYVCNATFRAALTGFDGPAGFIHVPAIRPGGAVAGVGEETDGVAPRWAARMTIDEAADGIVAALRHICQD